MSVKICHLFHFIIQYICDNYPVEARGEVYSTKIPTGPTGKSGPPQKVDQFFRNFSGWNELACVADALNLLYIGLYKGFRRVRGPAATQAKTNRSIEFWTEISGNFGWMDRAPDFSSSVFWKFFDNSTSYLASHAGVFREKKRKRKREEKRAPLKTPAWEATSYLRRHRPPNPRVGPRYLLISQGALKA